MYMFYILFILKWVLVGGGGGGGERELENDISPLCELLIGTNRVVHVCSISASPSLRRQRMAMAMAAYMHRSSDLAGKAKATLLPTSAQLCP